MSGATAWGRGPQALRLEQSSHELGDPGNACISHLRRERAPSGGLRACYARISASDPRSSELQPDRGSQAFEQFHRHAEADTVVFFDHKPRTRDAPGRHLLGVRRLEDPRMSGQGLHAG